MTFSSASLAASWLKVGEVLPKLTQCDIAYVVPVCVWVGVWCVWGGGYIQYSGLLDEYQHN